MSTWESASADLKREIAVHEAGHAVAARELDVALAYVRIGDGPELKLTREWDEDYFFMMDVGRDQQLQMVFAGGAGAEVIVFGAYGSAGITDDRRIVNQIEELNRQDDDDWAGEDVFDVYVARVARILSREKIFVVSDALMEKSYLTGGEVENVLSGHFPGS